MAITDFTLRSADISRGTGQVLQGLGALAQRKEQAAKEEQQKALMGQLYSAVQKGDSDTVSEIVSANPEFAKYAKEIGGVRDASQQREKLDTAYSMLTGDPVAALEESALRIDQRGGDSTQTRQMMEAIAQDPSKGRSMALSAIAMYGSPDQYKQLKKQFGGAGAGEALPAAAVTFNDLIKDFTPEQKKTARLVKAGLKARAMTNAELTAISTGEIKSYADWKAQMKQQQKFAEMTGSSRAKAIDKGFDNLVKIDSGIRNIDRAIAAIDRGAGVGAVEKLWPSIKAASVELDNIRGQMALDVVGATTFGALSKGELDLAKDIALPTGLDSAELKAYLVKKKVAQGKLRDYYNEQIQFLDQGGTVAGFLREKERGVQPGGGGAVSQDQEAIDWANANPNDPRAQKILQLQGGQ